MLFRSMTFGSLVAAQLLHALNYRSAHEPAERARNSILPSVIGGSLVAQSAAMLLPGLRNMLGVATIDVLDAIAMTAGGVLPFFVNAARKTEQVQKATLHFRSAKPGRPPSLRPQAEEEGLKVEWPSGLTRLPQRPAPVAPPTATPASASGAALARAFARRLQKSIP